MKWHHFLSRLRTSRLLVVIPLLACSLSIVSAAPGTSVPLGEAKPLEQVAPRPLPSFEPMPYPRPLVFEKFENYAIEMVPHSIRLFYSVPTHGSYNTIIANGATTNIYPDDRTVTVRYSLKNKTDKNYRFHVCLAFRSGVCLSPQLVTFIGAKTVSVTHTTPLPTGSGRLRVEASDILYEPIGNDVRPIYFSATVNARAPCPSGQSCCELRPNGSCIMCVPTGGPCP